MINAEQSGRDKFTTSGNNSRIMFSQVDHNSNQYLFYIVQVGNVRSFVCQEKYISAGPQCIVDP